VGIGGVILAAGESSRMGRDKALLPWPKDAGATSVGGTILSFAIKSLSPYCDFVMVVAGKNEDALRPVVYGCGASLVINSMPEHGQFSSLQTALWEVLNRGRDSAMVTLVDRPAPHAETLDELVKAFWVRRYGIWAIIPEYQGRHGHPIVIGREMIEAFLTAPETANAREIEHANQNKILYLPVNDPQVIMNADTPQEYASLESKT
jgi:molybdenum cofactor cytidylyltransferase